MLTFLGKLFPRFDLPQASTFAAGVDNLYDFVFWISTISFVVICIGLVGFSHRYSRKRNGEKTPYIEGHTPTEVGVSIGLFIVVMVIFYWGYKDYAIMRTMPTGALEINVTARQWSWEFQYANGRKSMNEFTVPRGRKVKMIMTSEDVLHSFYVPNFRVKQDVLPGTYTAVWFEPTIGGTHDLFCAEFCGTGHSQMLGKVTVVEPDAYDAWQLEWELRGLRDANEARSTKHEPPTTNHEPPAVQGKALFGAKGCTACHSVDGSKSVGPSMFQVFGRTEALADGGKATVDENYIRESLTDPQAKVVKDYPPVMPSFKGQLKDDEITALIEYMKTVK